MTTLSAPPSAVASSSTMPVIRSCSACTASSRTLDSTLRAYSAAAAFPPVSPAVPSAAGEATAAAAADPHAPSARAASTAAVNVRPSVKKSAGRVAHFCMRSSIWSTGPILAKAARSPSATRNAPGARKASTASSRRPMAAASRRGRSIHSRRVRRPIADLVRSSREKRDAPSLSPPGLALARRSGWCSGVKTLRVRRVSASTAM
mmetsp:Transcript_6357/g.9647  ORF Transcript_6357/g.9647 Transcript_6357/m.9647 type:complete len:205 (-) Transcript_6357:806-1420(-)